MKYDKYVTRVGFRTKTMERETANTWGRTGNFVEGSQNWPGGKEAVSRQREPGSKHSGPCKEPWSVHGSLQDMWEMPEKRRDSQCVNGRKQCVFIEGLTSMTPGSQPALFKLAKGKIKVGIHVSVFTMKIRQKTK